MGQSSKFGEDEVDAIMTRAEKKAREMNVPMTFAVVDDAGHLMQLRRMDGAGWLTADIAFAKAYTTVAFRAIGERFEDIRAIAERLKDQPFFLASLSALSGGKVCPALSGGLPIVMNGSLLGAIGASGGNAEQDDACARAGVNR